MWTLLCPMKCRSFFLAALDGVISLEVEDFALPLDFFFIFIFFSERRNGCVGKNLHQQPHHHQVITWCLAASASLLVLKVVSFVFHPELEGLEALLPALYSLSPMEQVN